MITKVKNYVRHKLKCYFIRKIDAIAYEIIDEIISPVCGISKGTIWADLFLADLDCYTMGTDKEDEKILDLVAERYGIEDRRYLDIFDKGPIIALAVYVYSCRTK